MADADAEGQGRDEIGGGYARYLLAILVLVYVLNFLDRQIISVLAEDIQRDLGIDDAQIGFLYGTAFAVFYAIFGIPLGRLADVWNRRTLIALGLSFWSAMTALSGLSQNFTQIAAARIGVGVGEASATPAAYSMLSDSFPVSRRATALAIYSSGIFIGSGLGLFLGGTISSSWDAAYAAGVAPFGLRGWQVAFLAMGIPGLLLALVVRTLREPVRGRVDGIAGPTEPHPFRVFGLELRAVVPGLTLLHLLLVRASATVIVANLAGAAGVAALVWGLVAATGNVAQWVALGIGLYAAISWSQALRIRDAASFRLIFQTRTLIFSSLGFSGLAFVGYGLGFWATPYAIRTFGVDAAEAGLWLGGAGALGGFVGVTFGGWLADRLRLHSRAGRIQVGMINAVAPIPIAFLMFTTEDQTTFYFMALLLNVAIALWIGPGATVVQDLVLPRMRATASAAYLLVVTFIGLALGPYAIGRISVATDSLRTGILAALAMNGVALVFLAIATRSIAQDEATMVERAGEDAPGGSV